MGAGWGIRRLAPRRLGGSPPADHAGRRSTDREPNRGWIPAGMIALAVAATDWGVKWWVASRLPLWSHEVLIEDRVALWHVRNDAMVLGLYGDLPLESRQAIAVMAGLLGALLLFEVLSRGHRLPGRKRRWVWAFVGLASGGMLGNLGERAVHWGVTDYLSLRWNHLWLPPGNIADIAIFASVPIALIVIVFELQARMRRGEARGDTSDPALGIGRAPWGVDGGAEPGSQPRKPPMHPNGAGPRERLIELLRGCGSVLVGYSGGVDSVFLAKLAVDTLGAANVLAVTGKSDSLPSWMEDTAASVAERFGIPWVEVDTLEVEDPRYAANPSNRCYFCKSELWSRLRGLADERGLRVVADGANADDVGDHRPGAAAASENGVRSPLLEAGLTKSEIREWSRELGLPTWDQPAAPCLASRLPYGFAVTPGRLRRVDAAETALRALGLRDFRVRHHGEVARLEVHPSELPFALREAARVGGAVRAAGFEKVVLDIEGYRRGALNEGLGSSQLVQLLPATG